MTTMTASAPPPSAPTAADDHPLIGPHQVGDRPPLLVFDQGAGWNLQHDVGRVLAVPPATAALPAALGGEVMLEAIVLQGVELPRDFEHDIAAATAVSPVWTSARHEFLAAEAQLPAPTIARLDEDLDPVREHQRAPVSARTAAD